MTSQHCFRICRKINTPTNPAFLSSSKLIEPLRCGNTPVLTFTQVMAPFAMLSPLLRPLNCTGVVDSCVFYFAWDDAWLSSTSRTFNLRLLCSNRVRRGCSYLPVWLHLPCCPHHIKMKCALGMLRAYRSLTACLAFSFSSWICFVNSMSNDFCFWSKLH